MFVLHIMFLIGIYRDVNTGCFNREFSSTLKTNMFYLALAFIDHSQLLQVQFVCVCACAHVFLSHIHMFQCTIFRDGAKVGD